MCYPGLRFNAYRRCLGLIERRLRHEPNLTAPFDTLHRSLLHMKGEDNEQSVGWSVVSQKLFEM